MRWVVKDVRGSIIARIESMKKATIKISRSLGPFFDHDGVLNFGEGDFYNIYHHAVADAGYGTGDNFLTKFFAFKVISISDTEVSIEKIYPLVDNISLKIGESKELFFEELGMYTVTLEKIEERVLFGV